MNFQRLQLKFCQFLKTIFSHKCLQNSISIIFSRFPESVTYLKSTANSTNGFDVLIFTQLWPQTVCLDLRQTSNSSYCNLPKEEKWTIHGIWPTQYHKLTPSDCNPSLNFNPSILDNIKEELETKWIYVNSKIHPELFWKHEWDKHGTCSTVIDSISTEMKYFRKGLELFDKYNVKNILEKANIVSGRQYSVQTILQRVDRILGVRNYVDCVKNQVKVDFFGVINLFRILDRKKKNFVFEFVQP